MKRMKNITIIINRSLAIICLFALYSCSSNKQLTFDYQLLSSGIKLEKPSEEMLKKFNKTVRGEWRTIKKDYKEYSGFVTNNKEFLEKIITPYLSVYAAELKLKSENQIINELTLFGHQIFQLYFGKDFYRWGGDILDLDDPQISSPRHEYAYGLDCSGFTTLAYELAVHFNLIDFKSRSALFSSKGFEYYCTQTNSKDEGGRDGTSNNFRVDTKDLSQLGDEIIKIEKGAAPTKEQMDKLQAGDIVGRSGHFGILVEINNDLYYLESGGWVVPKNGGLPYHAKEAIEIFAKNGDVYLRRCLKTIEKK
jgi:hypothetical protein